MGYKIKPKDFQKRRSQSQTYKDWNDENGSSAAYTRRNKRKPTILDDVEVHHAPQRTTKERISGNDTIGSSIIKLCEGNFKAVILLTTIASEVGELESTMMLLNMDSMGIYGSKIVEIYNNVGKDSAAFVEKINTMRRGE